MEALFEILSNETGQTRKVMEVDYERYAVGEALLGWVNIQGNLEAGPEEPEVPSGKKGKGVKGREGARILNPPQSTDKEHGQVHGEGYADALGRIANPRSVAGEGAGVPIDGNAWLMDLAEGIAERLTKLGIEVAHLKLSLTQGAGAVDKGMGGKGKGSRDKAGTGLATGGGMAAVQWVRSGSAPELTRRMAEPLTGGRLLINLRAEADPDVLVAATFAVLDGQMERRPRLVLSAVESQHFRPGKPVPTHRVGTA